MGCYIVYIFNNCEILVYFDKGGQSRVVELGIFKKVGYKLRESKWVGKAYILPVFLMNCGIWSWSFIDLFSA